MRIYTGKGVYGAIAIGKISIFSRQQIAITKLHIEDIDAEKARVQAAKEKSIAQLQEIYEKALKDVGEANCSDI